MSHPVLLSILLLAAPQDWVRSDSIPASVASLCAQYTVPPSPAAMAKREDDLEGKVRKDVNQPYWLELACLRERLAYTAVPLKKREGSLARNWHEAALWALLVAKEQAPQRDLALPVVEVSELMLREKEPTWEIVDRAALIAFDAVRSGDRRPLVRSACPRLLLAVSDTAAAVDCLRRTGQASSPLPSVKVLTAPIPYSPTLYRIWNGDVQHPLLLLSWDLAWAGKDLRSPEYVMRSHGNDPEPSLSRSDMPNTHWQASWSTSASVWERKPLERFEFTGGGGTTQERGNVSIWGIGSVFIPLSPGGMSWSVAMVTNLPGVRSRASGFQVPRRETSSLFLSDIVLSIAQERLEAKSALESPRPATVFRVPYSFRKLAVGFDTIQGRIASNFQHGSELGFFFQVGSTKMRDSAATTINLYKVDADSSQTPSLSFTFRSPVILGINNIQKTFDLEAIKPGNYRFEVVFTDRLTNERVRESAILTVEEKP